MKEIPLTQGKFAIVDDEDFERIACFEWRAAKKHKGNFCAYRWDGESKKTVYMHAVVIGASKGDKVDHKNHNGLDNRKNNLRLCTTRQNNQNRRRYSNNKTGLKGVCPSNRKRLPFRAQIRVNGKSKFLGHYPSPEVAARAYDIAAREYFGEFACLNFPNNTPKEA